MRRKSGTSAVFVTSLLYSDLWKTGMAFKRTWCFVRHWIGTHRGYFESGNEVLCFLKGGRDFLISFSRTLLHLFSSFVASYIYVVIQT